MMPRESVVRGGSRSTVIRGWILLLIFAAAHPFAGCSDDTSGPSQTATVMLVLESTGFAKRRTVDQPNSNESQRTIDSVSVTRVRLLFRSVKLRSLNDSLDLVPAALIGEISPSSPRSQIASLSIPLRKYTGLDILLPVPPPNASNLPEYGSPVFQEFLEGNGCCLIVNGIVYDPGGNSQFRWSCADPVEKCLAFVAPVTPVSGSVVTLTVQVDHRPWFKDSKTGLFLNPLDEDNRSRIVENVINSIRMK